MIMADVLQRDQFFLPATALASVYLDCLYLLAGEGGYLKIFHHDAKQLLNTKRVFEWQVIHGIAWHNVSEAGKEQALLLVWGGYSVCVLGIQSIQAASHEIQITFTDRVPAMELGDWILDGCFRDLLPSAPSPERTYFDSLLVTAHNEIYTLKFDKTQSICSEKVFTLARAASGPSSILYSAHVVWLSIGRILIAAGTVFGDVMLWSHDPGIDEGNGVSTFSHKFEGHEGSVFGVQISEPHKVDARNGDGVRLLASCSDDRTIKMWDISNTSSRPQLNVTSQEKKESDMAAFPDGTTFTGCVASVMGHASRIWGLRFLIQNDNSWDLVSHGEDVTVQAWRMTAYTDKSEPIEAKSAYMWELKHHTTFSYHSGKNIWAIARYFETSEMVVIATGGADGRIATYKPNLHNSVCEVSSTTQFTMRDVADMARLGTEDTFPFMTKTVPSILQKIFDGFRGQWKLSRNIESFDLNYPSGVLEGISTFHSRPPTDQKFSAEYLYSENGDFHTESGLTMKTTRQYVYRYREDKDEISVWFVKPEDGITVDYLFHDLDFHDLVDEQRQQVKDNPSTRLTAWGRHLCGEDDYKAAYSFSLGDFILGKWTVTFTVLGPKKDYKATATYARDGRRDLPDAVHTFCPISQTSNPRADITKGSGIARASTPKPDTFKTYAWLGESQFLTSSEQGNLLVGTLDTRLKDNDGSLVSWKHVSQQPLLRSSCVATSVVSQGICFLTGMDGAIFLYNHSSRSTGVVHSLSRKAGFLKAQSISMNWRKPSPKACKQTAIGVVATGLGSSEATALVLYPDEESSIPSVKVERRLGLPTDFVVTSSCFKDGEPVIFLGSRSGGLAIYGPSDSTPDFARQGICSHFPRVHGQDAVTAIQMVPHDASSSKNACLVTTGRDGTYGIHLVSTGGFDLSHGLQTLHVGVTPFGPNIEGICLDADNLYLWGFRSKEFVVWNETERTEVMTVDCGGAHRNWAYHHRQDGSGGGNFVYTKASVCHVHSQTQAFHKVMQQGGHGREIKAMALSPPISDSGHGMLYLATGAEDTAIRIFDATSSTSKEGVKCMSIITKHTTGLQMLQWSPDGRRLFSAAGCEEFFVWRLQPAPLVKIGVVCEAHCPRATEEGDLRIMDFAILTIQSETTELQDEDDAEGKYMITMAYSDSSVRVFKYSTHTKTFTILFSGTYTTYCLTQATYIHSADNVCICTASTDGHLTFWPLPLQRAQRPSAGSIIPIVTVSPSPPSSTIPTTLTHSKRICVHQNSVKSTIATFISQSETIIITGGDDGAIALTRLHRPLEEPSSHSTLLIPKAHASAVTAIAHLGELEAGSSHPIVRHRFASVSNDQRLTTWIVTIDLPQKGSEGVGIRKESNMSTFVADASSLDVSVDGEERKRLYVAGIGMESWRVG